VPVYLKLALIFRKQVLMLRIYVEGLHEGSRILYLRNKFGESQDLSEDGENNSEYLNWFIVWTGHKYICIVGRLEKGLLEPSKRHQQRGSHDSGTDCEWSLADWLPSEWSIWIVQTQSHSFLNCRNQINNVKWTQLKYR